MNDGPPMTRKPLNLKPRTDAKSAESTPKSTDGPKSDPFGGANAMTLTKQQEMDKRMEEKLNQQMSSSAGERGGDRFGDRSDRGYNRGGFDRQDNRGGYDR